VAEIEPGGYLFYDSTRPLPPGSLRDDVTTIGVPLTRSPTRHYTDPRQRQLFKNIIYVGALSMLLDVDAEVFEKLFAEQYKGKERLLDSQRAGAAPGPRLRARRTCRTRWACACSAPTRSATRSSPTATAPPRWAASTAVPRWLRLVPDHAFVVIPGGLPEVLRQVPHRPGHRHAPLCHRAGRGRTRLHRHGRGRRLERRARLHRHLGPGHLA
jgi:hypothetical protein